MVRVRYRLQKLVCLTFTLFHLIVLVCGEDEKLELDVKGITVEASRGEVRLYQTSRSESINSLDLIAEALRSKGSSAKNREPEPIIPKEDLKDGDSLKAIIPSPREKAMQTQYLIRHPQKSAHFPMKRDSNSVDPHWKAGGPVVLLIHGFNPLTVVDSIRSIKAQKIFAISEAFSKWNSSYNIIVVDWMAAATHHLMFYYKAAEATKYVGEEVGKFLLNLKSLNMISTWDQVYLVGFSLGAHVSGVAGHWIQKNGEGKIGRITGIDPAGPLFEDNGKMLGDTTRCIDPSDAKFVDIMHCNMMNKGRVQSGRFGSRIQSGHADFYINGGETQFPYCTATTDRVAACSHLTCMNLFASSLNQDTMACPCESWNRFVNQECKCDANEMVPIGARAPPSAKGKYQVRLEEKVLN